MSEELGFLKAIAREPHDDDHRLIYADWLEDHGDPNRAELIRLQCKLEQGIDWETGQPANDERLVALKNREQALITEMLNAADRGEQPNIRELTPDIAKIAASDHRRITFRRGMIGSLNLSRSPVSALPPDLLVGGDLNLSDTRIAALPPDLNVTGDLYLCDTRITALPPGLNVGGSLYLFGAPVNALPPGLHVSGNLYLSGTRITALPPDLHVGGNLDLSGNRISAEAVRRILTMPNLSREARITGLDTAGYPSLAIQARRQPDGQAGPGTPPTP